MLWHSSWSHSPSWFHPFWCQGEVGAWVGAEGQGTYWRDGMGGFLLLHPGGHPGSLQLLSSDNAEVVPDQSSPKSTGNLSICPSKARWNGPPWHLYLEGDAWRRNTRLPKGWEGRGACREMLSSIGDVFLALGETASAFTGSTIGGFVQDLALLADPPRVAGRLTLARR